ncbi:hypothetical protein [Streptomyces chartreusis]
MPLFKGESHYYFAKTFTSSDFMVTGIVILIAGNVELHCGYIAPGHELRAKVIKGASLVAGLAGTFGYVTRFESEEEAISGKADLVTPTSLLVTCAVVFAAMIVLAVAAARLPSVPPTTLE